MIAATAEAYRDAFERITGQTFVPDLTGATPLVRIRANLRPFFPGPHSPRQKTPP